MYKIFFNTLIQLIAIFLTIKYFIFDNISEEKLSLILSPYVVLLFLFLVLLKFLISYLFYQILNTISGKDIPFFNTSEIFLFGGVINQLIPGLGYVFKYYKLRSNAGVTISSFTVSQGIWSLKSFSAYIILALLCGFIYIHSFDFLYSFLLLFLFITLALTFFYSRKYLLKFIKEKSLMINRLNNLLNELKKIKEIIKYNFKKFIFIFLGFIILSLLECIAFYIGLIIFGADMSFMTSNYIYILSSLSSVIILINYLGFFELILLAAASIIAPNFNDMLIFGISYRIINTSALIFTAVSSSILVFILKKRANLKN
tara:strand:+ start:202 stop:1146 length:945 start_codon:yes stop_codon:yes gene_type:complete